MSIINTRVFLQKKKNAMTSPVHMDICHSHCWSSCSGQEITIPFTSFLHQFAILTAGAAAQVASLDTLARLYIARFQYADAAAVYAALATRRAGLGDQAVDLAERLDLYQSAVLQARRTYQAFHVFLWVRIMSECERESEVLLSR